MIPSFLALIPLFFLPFTQDYFDTNKWMALCLITLSATLVWAWSCMRTTHVHITLSRSTIGLAALTIASLLSLLIASTNKIEALLHPLGPITFGSLTLLSLFTVPSKRFLWLLFGAASILSLIAIYRFFGLGGSDTLWSPTGSALATTTIIALVIPLLATGIREAYTHKHEGLLALLILMVVVNTAGLGIILWQLIPKLPEVLLSPKEGWSIMLEILKNPKQAFVGVGVENFLTAFTAGRPMRLNLTELWASRFTTNTNVFFHLTTIYGLTGLVALLVFFRSLLIKTKRSGLSISLLVALGAFLLTPPNLSVLIVCVGLLMSTPSEKKTFKVSPWLSTVLFFTVVILTIISSYSLVRFYVAEVFFARSITASAQNDGSASYNLQVQAIHFNPVISRFHIFNSQTSLVLSLSLSKFIVEQSQAPQEDQEKNRLLVGQLIQQAIHEGKIAVNLNPMNILAWENLARVYGQLIGIAQGADTWAQSTYAQAIRLDPYNPVLAVELGGVYIRKKEYTTAITQFTRATNLKPDYANAWYNLANAYRLNGDGENMRIALEKTLTLVKLGSSDYQIIQAELNDQAASVSGTLTTPTPAPIIDPPLNVQP